MYVKAIDLRPATTKRAENSSKSNPKAGQSPNATTAVSCGRLNKFMSNASVKLELVRAQKQRSDREKVGGVT